MAHLLPLPRTDSPAGPRTPRPTRGVVGLVLSAFVLAALSAVAGHGAAVVALGAATVLLVAAGALALRVHWDALAPAGDPDDGGTRRSRRDGGRLGGPLTDVPPSSDDDDDVSRRLGALHEAHVAKVNAALDQGRDDLADELARAYTDAALAVLTTA